MKPFKIGDICVALKDKPSFEPIKSGDILEIIYLDAYKFGQIFYAVRCYNHDHNEVNLGFVSHNNLQKIGEL
jgi:hypothetical protein